MSRQFDAIIIGTGQAGPSLAARFADAGMSVAIIERHKVWWHLCEYGMYTNKDVRC
jgi:pyruvate/2-oxoglutarate dehydrogenase complex dihydrolipoamide dehydrogenase (E3) component